MPEYQHLDHAPFLGLNEDDNLLMLRDGELQVAENVFHLGNVLHTRPGLVEDPDGEYTVAGIPEALKPIEGAFEFRKEFGASRTLLIFHNGLLYKNFDVPTPTSYAVGSWDVTATADSGTGSPWVMAQHRNVVFGAGGATDADDAFALSDPSGTPTMIRLQLEASTGVPSTGSAFTPRLVFEKWNYVFAAQFYNASSGTTSTTVSSDSNANPLVVRYSDLGVMDATDIDTLGASFPYSNAIGGPGIGGFSGDYGNWITGFGEYTDNSGDWLIVGTRRKLYSVRQQVGVPDRPFAVTDEIPNGLVHQRAFVSLGVDSGDAVYMSDRGIHSLRQSQQFGARQNSFLSWPIRKTFAGLDKTKLHLATGAYWPKEGLIVFAAPKTGSSGKVTQMMAMDIKSLGQGPLGNPLDITAANVRWYLWTLADDTEGPAIVWSARDSNDEYFIYGGTYTGDVGQFQTTTYLDLGAGYRTRWRTNDRHLGVWGREKQLGDVYVKALVSTDTYEPRLTASFDFDRVRVSRDVDLSLGSQATWDVAEWFQKRSTIGDEWANEQTLLRIKLNFMGSGETLAMEMDHKPGGTVSQPLGVCQITAEVASLGEDLGDSEV